MAAPLIITPRVEDEIGILEVSGGLMLGPSLSGLRNSARQLLDGHKLKGLIVDAHAVKQTDSAGLGELTVVYTITTKKNCPLRLVGVRPELRKVLELTRLDGLMPIAEDLETAKREMKKTPVKRA
jgi:anti-anti-sigma factor